MTINEKLKLLAPDLTIAFPRSPLLAMATGGVGYIMLKGLRIASGIREETCVCVGNEWIHGLPVSTTHVSAGSLLGMRTVTGQAKWKTVFPVRAS